MLPASVTTTASSRGPTSRLLVTHAGYFPRASRHDLLRRSGAPGTIVILCTAGHGWCRATESVRVGPRQALVIPAATAHSYGADDDDPWTIWWLHAYGPDTRYFEEELRMAVGGPPGRPTVIDVHDVFRLSADIERVVQQMETDETRSTLLRASGIAWSILGQLTADARTGNPLRTEPVRQAQDYIREHLDAPVSVSALARTAGLSTSHFAALFHAATGGGVIEYAKRLRMAQARELLITTDIPIAEVARSVGYKDPLYFSRQFRSVHSSSPTEFRRQR
jgi:AraC family transcriptional regulator of arabinose operon